MAKCICTVCKSDNPTFSFALKREKGKWVVTPVCRKCRRALIAEARAAKKFIPFYGLEASIREAEKRNAERASFRPFLDAFAKAEEKPKKRLLSKL